MDKRHLHHLWTKFRLIKPWYFLILAVLSTVIAVFALRANNEHMIELRDAVYAADKNNTDIQKPLKDLQSYVTSHMNTNLSSNQNTVYPPIQLKYTYERLIEAQKNQSSSVADANSQIYNQAQAYCEGQNSTDVSGRNRVPCIQQYVQSHTVASTTQAQIPDALYKFSFVSPRWSSDLAGWSILAAILSGLLFVITLTARLLIKKAAN